MDKEKYKSTGIKRTKGKAPVPSNLIALGKHAQVRGGASDSEFGVSRKFTSSPLNERKRDAEIQLMSLPKKPKLLTQTFTPLGRGLDDRRASPSLKLSFEEIAMEVDNESFLQEVLMADASDEKDRVEGLVCGAVKQLRSSRFKPDLCLCVSLMYLAKYRADIFISDVLTEAFCYLLKRETTASFKSKGNPTVSVLACNILMAAYYDVDNWPLQFIKIFAEDSLADRVWVDRRDCSTFVRNILTAFDTKFPPEEKLMSFLEGVSSDHSAASSPHVFHKDDDRMEVETLEIPLMISECLEDIDISPRFATQKTAAESYIIELLSEQLGRRGNMDIPVRNLIKLITVVCCYCDVRLMASQRLEMWYSLKFIKCAQDLLMTICVNCDMSDKRDSDVVVQLLKIRLKTKPLLNHFLLCVKELLNKSAGNLRSIMTHSIYNELSNARHPNNMPILQSCLQHSLSDSSTILADIFQDLLSNREDYLRALRALLREIIRAAKPDIDFTVFCRGLMRARSEKKFKDMDPAMKERYFLSISDLLTLSMLLGMNPQVRESHTVLTKGESTDSFIVVSYLQQVAEIQRDCISWFHVSLPNQCDLKPHDYLQCIRKTLFLLAPDQYRWIDNWPPENERGTMLKILSKSPILEDTLTRLMIIGLDTSLPLLPVEALEICEHLVLRAAAKSYTGLLSLYIERVEIIDLLFNLTRYHHPDNISLPKGVVIPNLAVVGQYWKVYAILLVVTAHNPQVFGNIAWKDYETLKFLIEMVITNQFQFPPPTLFNDEKSLNDFRCKYRMAVEQEKHMILEFEGHLAAATTQEIITQENNHLLSTLISLDPGGIARKPSHEVMEQIKEFSHSLQLRELLCKSRNPDMLLEIIERQGSKQSMPWLADLVHSSESSFDVLPVQCLCEFLLMDHKTSADDGLDYPESSTISMTDKHAALLHRMQTLVASPDADPWWTSQLLDYFFNRLSSEKISSRLQATKGLSMILDAVIPSSQSDFILSNFPEQRWLLSCFPSIPIFNNVVRKTCSAISKALKVESCPDHLGSYVIFLSQFTENMELDELQKIVLDLSHLVVERTTVMYNLLPSDVLNESPKLMAILSSFFSLYANYMRKARCISTNAYTWSNIQDQIMVRWSAGVSATIPILVAHATVIILTFNPNKPDEDYIELLNMWFPTNEQPPSAYLLDTSEEALLLPDWLKLRMIRSSVKQIIDAALQESDSAQLLLYVQSFGIPAENMDRLLSLLDDVSASDPGNLRRQVLNPRYMLQLLDIQKTRGVSSGQKFAELLRETVKIPDPSHQKSSTAISSSTTVSDPWTKSVDSRLSEPSSHSAIADILLEILNISDYSDSLKKTQNLIQMMIKDQSVVEKISAAIHLIIKCKMSALSGFTHEATVNTTLPLLHTVFHGKKREKDSKKDLLTETLTRLCKNEDAPLLFYLRKIFSTDEESDSSKGGMKDELTEKTIDKFVSIKVPDSELSNLAQEICQSVFLATPSDERKINSENGLSNKPTAAKTNPRGGSAYLLSVLIHQSSWPLIHECICHLLGSSGHLYDSTLTLNFLYACYNIPKIWQGQGINRPAKKHCEDVYNLTSAQLPFLTDHLINELKIYDSSSLDVTSCDKKSTDVVKSRQISSDYSSLESFSFKNRMDFLLKVVANQDARLRTIVEHCQRQLTTHKDNHRFYQYLLTEIYIQWPFSISWLHDSAVIHDEKFLSSHRNLSQIDAVTHRLINTLTSPRPGKASDQKMIDANVACRKLASHHPSLFLRQLPMLVALLQGTTNYGLPEMKHRKYLILFTHILGLLELLEPHIFDPKITGLSDAIDIYFDLFQRHGLEQKSLASIISKFMTFLHNFLSCCPQRAEMTLRKHVDIISDLSSAYPELSILKSLVASLTLPAITENFKVQQENPDSRNIRPVSPWTPNQLAPFHKQLQKLTSFKDALAVLNDLDESSKRKVSILAHFLNDLLPILMIKHHDCRSQAHMLVLRYVRHRPDSASNVLATFLQCLDSPDANVQSTALKSLPEFASLCREHAPVLLQHAFMSGVKNAIDTSSAISDTFKMLTLMNGYC